MASTAPTLASDMSEEEFERRTLDAIHRELGPGEKLDRTNFR